MVEGHTLALRYDIRTDERGVKTHARAVVYDKTTGAVLAEGWWYAYERGHLAAKEGQVLLADVRRREQQSAPTTARPDHGRD